MTANILAAKMMLTVIGGLEPLNICLIMSNILLMIVSQGVKGGGKVTLVEVDKPTFKLKLEYTKMSLVPSV